MKPRISSAVHDARYWRFERTSGIPHGYFDPPHWMTQRRVRWTVIAIGCVALLCAYLTTSSVAGW